MSDAAFRACWLLLPVRVCCAVGVVDATAMACAKRWNLVVALFMCEANVCSPMFALVSWLVVSFVLLAWTGGLFVQELSTMHTS